MHDTGAVVKGNRRGRTAEPARRSTRALLCPQAATQSVCCRLGAIDGAGFGEDVAHVRSDGVEADAEGVSNLSVAATRSQEAQHLNLALTEVVKDIKRSGH